MFKNALCALVIVLMGSTALYSAASYLDIVANSSDFGQ